MALPFQPLLPDRFLSARPQPTLTAGDLQLRPWELTDGPVIVEAFQDPDIQHWHIQTVATHEVQGWIERRRNRWTQDTGADWAVVAGERPVGRVAVRDLDRDQACGEVSYWVLPAARGTGVARRSLQALTEWAADLGVHRLKLEHAVDNAASCRVAHAVGYELEGVHRQALRHADGWHDTHIHARLLAPPMTPRT